MAVAPSVGVESMLEKSRRNYWVTGVVCTVGLPIGSYFLFQDWLIVLSLFVMSLWLTSAFSRNVSPEWNLSACKIYLPVFTGYSLIGLGASNLGNTRVIAFAIVGSALAFSLGWLFSMPSGIHRVDKSVAPSRDYIVGSHFRMGWVWTFSVATLTIYGVLALRAGGLPAFADQPNIARTTFYPSGYVAMFVVMGVHVMSFVGLTKAVLERGNRFLGLLLWLAATGMALGTANRGVVFIPMVLSLVFITFRNRSNVARVVPVALLAALAFSALGYSRSSTSNGSVEYQRYLLKMGYDGPAQLFAPILNYMRSTIQTFDLSISYFPDVVDFAYGKQFFSPLLLQQSVDLYLKEEFGAKFGGFGLALGSMNALYIDWGLAGVLGGMFLFGLMSGWLFVKALRTGSLTWVVLYSYALTQLLLSVYGHPFAYLYYIVEPILLVFIMTKVPKGSSPSVIAPGSASRAVSLPEVSFQFRRGICR